MLAARSSCDDVRSPEDSLVLVEKQAVFCYHGNENTDWNLLEGRGKLWAQYAEQIAVNAE